MADSKMAPSGAGRTSPHAARLWQLGELGASLAHDLGQPLNIIRLTAENALDALAHGRGDPERLRRTLETVVDQSRRTQAMMDALLEVTRRPTLPAVPLDPVEALEQALAAVGPRLEGIRLARHADSRCPRVLGYPARLRAVLVHILTNACEAMAAATMRGEPAGLEVSCRGEDGQVLYAIADSGPGFPAELRAGLDDPLFQTAARGKGCGLGLTLALGIVGEMGGSLTVADGRPGTRVEIRLPAMPAHGVLLVDDDPQAAQALADDLAGRGWRVRVAGSGSRALEMFQHEAADAVVTALGMIDGNGAVLIECLRGLAPDLPVIALCATGGKEVQRAVSAGAVLVLERTAQPGELAEELNNLKEGMLNLYS